MIAVEMFQEREAVLAYINANIDTMEKVLKNDVQDEAARAKQEYAILRLRILAQGIQSGMHTIE